MYEDKEEIIRRLNLSADLIIDSTYQDEGFRHYDIVGERETLKQVKVSTQGKMYEKNDGKWEQIKGVHDEEERYIRKEV